MSTWRRHGLSRLVSVVVVASVTLLGAGVEASGADPQTLTVSPTTVMPGETITFSGTGWVGCSFVTVHLIVDPGADNVANVPFSQTTGNISGTFTAPTTPGSYTVTGSTNPGDVNCSATAAFDVVAPTSPTTTTTTTVPTTTTTTTVAGAEGPGEPETGPGEPEAAPAPISSTPIHVTG
jgi:hypothetical protein